MLDRERILSIVLSIATIVGVIFIIVNFDAVSTILLAGFLFLLVKLLKILIIVGLIALVAAAIRRHWRMWGRWGRW